MRFLSENKKVMSKAIGNALISAAE